MLIGTLLISQNFIPFFYGNMKACYLVQRLVRFRQIFMYIVKEDFAVIVFVLVVSLFKDL